MSAIPNEDVVRQRVRAASPHRDTFTKADFDLSTGVPDSQEVVAELQVKRPHVLQSFEEVDLAVMAYEEFTANGTGGDQETFNLSHDLVESGATDQPVLVYEGDSHLATDSIDYDADTVTVTPANADSTIGIYYSAGDQAQLTVQKVAPNGTTEKLHTADLGLVHLRNHAKDPMDFDLTDSFWTPYLAKDWKLQVVLEAPYTARWAKDIGGDGNDETATNALVSIPYKSTQTNIDGLGAVLRTDAARR